MCAKYVNCTFILYITFVLFSLTGLAFPMLPRGLVKPHSPANKSEPSGANKASKSHPATSIRLQFSEHLSINTGGGHVEGGHNQSKSFETQSHGNPILTGKKGHFTRVDRGSHRNLDVLLRELSENLFYEDDREESHSDSLKDVQMSRMIDLGHALAPVFSRLHRRASFRERLPLIFDEHVSIGRARVAKRRATSVGDIDGNGVVDFIIADPLAKNESGKVRLFLMAKGAHYLHTREITPGISDFDAPELKPGHRYGTAVFRLPGGNATTGSFVAISAPGDGKNGAIYIVKISHEGDILCHAKAQLNGRGNHPNRKPIPMSALGKGGPRVQVQTEIINNTGNAGILSDVQKIVFEAPDGEVLATLVIDSADDAKLLSLVEAEYLLSTSLRPLQRPRTFPRFPVKVGIDSSAPIAGDCFINSTHCPCAEPNQKEENCLSFLREDPSSGRSICVTSTCPQHVQCQCGGKHVCKRSDLEPGHYVAEEMVSELKSGGKEVYCKVAEGSGLSRRLRNNGFANSSAKQGSLELFNKTHCLCSQKSSMWNVGRCLRYSRTSYGLAIYCLWKPCQVGSKEYQCDNLGSAYCRRDVETRSYWSEDGAVVDLDDVVYCHEVQGNVEKVSLLFHV